jgi:23S rRNA pseudouridine1911/1915/1917 synthase
MLEHYLEKDEVTNIVKIVTPLSNNGKKAVLEYEVHDSVENFSLVDIKLHTGRPHQIRVQFAAIGHPLYGDRKYGSLPSYIDEQIALWAVKLSFLHPTLKNMQVFQSLPPDIYPWNLFN